MLTFRAPWAAPRGGRTRRRADAARCRQHRSSTRQWLRLRDHSSVERWPAAQPLHVQRWGAGGEGGQPWSMRGAIAWYWSSRHWPSVQRHRRCWGWGGEALAVEARSQRHATCASAGGGPQRPHARRGWQPLGRRRRVHRVVRSIHGEPCTACASRLHVGRAGVAAPPPPLLGVGRPRPRATSSSMPHARLGRQPRSAVSRHAPRPSMRDRDVRRRSRARRSSGASARARRSPAAVRGSRVVSVIAVLSLRRFRTVRPVSMVQAGRHSSVISPSARLVEVVAGPRSPSRRIGSGPEQVQHLASRVSSGSDRALRCQV